MPPHRSEERIATAWLAGATLAALLAAFLWLALLSFSPADAWALASPEDGEIHNLCGPVGAAVAGALFRYVGSGAWLVALFTAGCALALLRTGRIPRLGARLVGLALLVASVATLSFVASPRPPYPLPEVVGGVVGIAIGGWLTSHFHWAGTVAIVLYGLITGLALCCDEVIVWSWRVVRRLWEHRAALARAGALRDAVRGWWKRIHPVPAADIPGRRRPVPVRTHRMPTDQEASAEDETQRAEPRDAAGRTGAAEVTTGAAASPSDTPRGGALPSPSAPRDGEAAPLPPPPYPRTLGEWEPPPISLLTSPEYGGESEHEEAVREKAAILEKTLADFRVDARVVEIDTGPVITLYELQVAAGVKVAHITALANDMARALRAPSVRVVAPLPGKNTVGIEVPNASKEIVRLKELFTLAGTCVQQMQLPLFLGKDASGNPLVADLTRMPHLLIAGTTGSGKSVCINSIIMSILMTQRPDMVKLILVDPKMVELSQYRQVPHLMCPIVTDMQRAESILDWVTTKMDERYELLAEAGVRNIAAYNRLTREELEARFQPTTEEERQRIPTHLPYIVIVIDELADLMMLAAKEVEHFLARLAQKSRAVGIHIIVATQRPEARIVTGLIKSNLPTRICFRVSSRMDSRIVLDQNGAEVLMGQGDMLFLPPGSSKLIRAQGTFVDDTELRRVLDYLAEKAQPEFHPELVRLRTADPAEIARQDDLFDEAVRIVLETRRGSVSLLQRRLMIGYSRASRLIDMMAEAGVVGDYKGSQAREVLMTPEEWEELRHGRTGQGHGGEPVTIATSGSAEDEQDDEAD